MSGTPRTLVLSEEEMAAIADAAVADLARRLADRAFRPLYDAGTAGHDTVSHEIVDGEALARLHALVQLQRAVERQKDRAAELAVRAGAGYPQLGQACAMSRQGARRRWPGLVTTGGAPATRRTVSPTQHPAPIDRSH
ncbi:hypothetical protein ACEZCY_17875 [Streptacidiphilus sp. N1-12]|uniref:Uncharacterized protein n=2 Tax=Streptacidiphilus alkalitolerans TaxID=3342712 RepID=A0ABV6VC54_9ACTN